MSSLNLKILRASVNFAGGAGKRFGEFLRIEISNVVDTTLFVLYTFHACIKGFYLRGVNFGSCDHKLANPNH